MSSNALRKIVICLVLLVLCAAIPGVCYGQTWLDNISNVSNDNSAENVRTSSHFRVVWGTQQTSSIPIDEDFIQITLQNLEYNYKKDHNAPPYGFSFRDPSIADPDDGYRYRANLYINNTHGSTGDGFAYGWADGRNLSEFSICAEGLNLLDPPSDVHPHEYGHGNIIASRGINTTSGEWHEGTANWFSCMRDDDYDPSIMRYNSWFPLPHGRDYYGAWPIWEAFRENANFGPTAISNAFAAGSTTLHIFDELAALYTASADGKGAVKNVFGEYAAKSVAWDYQRGEFFAARQPNFDPRAGLVFPLKKAGSSTTYRCPWEQAPSQHGFNIIPLTASPSTTVTVNFNGVWDYQRGTDYRVCFVAVSNNNTPRYSRFWNQGINSITLSADESKLYLVVVSTPDVRSITFNRDLQSDLTKEPMGYEITLTNATITEPTNGSRGSGWHQHSNGGGWVQDSASVASTAYVGPNAIVQDYAVVSGNARIEDYAVIAWAGQVRDNAVVSGHAVVTDGSQVYGNAKVRDWAVCQGSTQIYGNARILEHGNPIENVVVCDNACVRGYAWWYGTGAIVLNGYAIADGDAADGSNLDHGTSTGWSWGPNQGYNDGLTDTGGIFCQYLFENVSPIYAKDTYGMAWGYLVNKPQTVMIADWYRKNSLQLDGSTQYIECPKNLNDIKDTTIMVWVKWTGSANDQRIFSFGDGSGKYMYLTPKDTSTGKLRFVITNGTTTQYIDGAAALTANSWQHIAVSFSGNTGTLYLNGAVAGTNTGMTLNPDDCNAANTVATPNNNYIGRGNTGNYFQGYIDDFRVYSLVKDATFISGVAAKFQDRNAGPGIPNPPAPPAPTNVWYKFDETSGTSAADSSGAGKTGTVSNGTWTTGKVNNCLNFNGTTTGVVMPDLGSFTAFTLSCWVNLGVMRDWQAIMHCDGWDYQDAHLSFQGGGNLFFSVNGNDPVDVGSAAIYDASTINTWKLITVVYDSAAKIVKFYADGALISTASYNTAVTANLAGGIHLGNWGGGDRFYQGKLDDFKIWNRALTDEEVANLMIYSAPPTDTTAPTPNPATWLIPPAAAGDSTINMVATKATDAGGNGVEYSFTCTAGGGHSSGWISSNQYTDCGLTAGTQYTYTVQTRDGKGNTGTASSASSATPSTDSSAPTPNPATFAIAPRGLDNSSIYMAATKGTDANTLIEYKFTGSNGHTSGWQASPVWTDTGLAANATATYTVQMRDGKGNTGTASASSPTATARDNTPPTLPGATYDPITSPWLTRPVVKTNGTLYMTAKAASDPAGVQYYFYCSSGGGPSSGWVDSQSWTSPVVANGTYTYQVKVRDKSAQYNETAYVGSESVVVNDQRVRKSYALSALSGLADQTLVTFNGTVTTVNATSYIVTSGSYTVRVFPNTYGQATDSTMLNKAVTVKGAMWTYTAYGKVVAFADLAKTQYIITATAGVGGIISPSGSVAVDSGANQAFTMTPDPFYQVSQVAVDGVNQGAITTYTFTNVQAAHTIAATFAPRTGDQVAWWKFDETSGTSAADSSGNGRTATLSGSCAWVTGKIANAVDIPGGTSYVSCPNGITSGVTNFSVSAWVYLDTRSANMRIFDFGRSTSYYMEMTPLHATSNGRYQFVIKSGTTTKTVTGTAALPTGSWQFVTVTLNSQTLTLYLNGAQVGQITNCTINPNSLGSTTINRIGDSQTSSHPHLDGKVDDFRFYNRALTLAEIQSLYNSADVYLAYYKFDETSGSSAADSSGQGKTATCSGGYSWVAGKTNNCISLDGLSGSVSVPDLGSQSAFSIVTWINMTARGTDYASLYLTDSWTTGSLHANIQTDGHFAFQVNGWDAAPMSTAILPIGSWAHAALVYDGSTAKIYYNGALDASVNITVPVAANMTGGKIGSWGGGSRFLNAKIDGYRIYKRALSASEISSLYGGGSGAASVDNDEDSNVVIPAE